VPSLCTQSGTKKNTEIQNVTANIKKSIY
jgi:hypothetical protein